MACKMLDEPTPRDSMRGKVARFLVAVALLVLVLPSIGSGRFVSLSVPDRLPSPVTFGTVSPSPPVTFHDPKASPAPARAGADVLAPGAPSCSPLPCVAETIDLVNNTTTPGNLLAGNAVPPTSVAWDSGKDQYFVTGEYGVAIFSGSNDAEIASVQVGGAPDGIAYDPARGEVFVANTGSDTVSVINDTNDSVVATIRVGSSPDAVAFDNETDSVYVADVNPYPNAGALSVISSTNNTDWTTIQLTGYDPEGLAYADGQLFVTERGAGRVEYVYGSNNTLGGGISVGSQPIGIASDAARDELYVANLASSSLSVISGASHSVVAWIYPTSAEPDGVVYDSASGHVYSTDNQNDLVIVIDASNNSIIGNVSVGYLPEAIADDPTDATVLALAWGSDDAWAISTRSQTVVDVFGSGPTPDGIAYDSANGNLYVAEDYQPTVLAVSAETGLVVGRIQIGNFPKNYVWARSDIVYDGARDELFVSDDYGDKVAVLSPAINRVVANISLPVGSDPSGLAYDPTDGEMFVADFGSGDLSVINDTNDSVVATVSVGVAVDPYNLVYDPITREVFDANWGGGVTVVSVPSNRIVTTIPLAGGDNLGGIFYDPQNSTVLVSDYDGYVYSFVYVISDVTNSVVSQIRTAGNPAGITCYDGQVYVMDQRYNRVDVYSEWNGSSLAEMTVGAIPSLAVLDPATGLLYGTNTGEGTLSVITPSPGTTPMAYVVAFKESGLPPEDTWWVNVTGQSPQEAVDSMLEIQLVSGNYSYAVSSTNPAFSSEGGSFSVNNASKVITVTFSENFYLISFAESGLVNGATWYVNVSGFGGPYQLSGLIGPAEGAILSGAIPNGSYSYSVATNEKNWTPIQGAGTFTVSGKPLSFSVGFKAYSTFVTFAQSGLPAGVLWFVNVTGLPALASSSSSLVLSLSNGTYSYAVSSTDKRFAPASYSGEVTVAGVARTVRLAFSLVTYSATFTESGLPTATAWWVNITGEPVLEGAGAVLSTSLSNASYVFTVSTGDKRYAPSYGAGFTIDGAPASPAVTFILVTYAVTFTASGLPSGTDWWVNGTVLGSFSTTASTLSFGETNGTYLYSVATTDKRYAAVGGLFIVNGSAVPKSVVFALVTYAVMFSETGLPSGTNWSVMVEGMTHYSTGPIIEVPEPNGSYPFTVGSVSGYAANRLSGNLTVSGSSTVEPLTFKSTSQGTTSVGVPSAESYAVVAGVVAVILAVLAAALFVRRRRRKTAAVLPLTPSPLPTPPRCS